MADWSMQPAAVWDPCDLHLANWTTEHHSKNWIPEPVVYAPCLSMEYASTNIYGSCIQTSAPYPNGQIVEYAAAVPIGIPEKEFEVDSHNMEIVVVDNSKCILQGPAEEVAEAEKTIKAKIHKYPEIIARAEVLQKRGATVPMVVAIGPYHHDQANLKETEKLKHTAAWLCVADAGLSSVQDMYDAVVAAAQGARELYDKDVVAGISDDDFLPMMFYDACFLVQYMVAFADKIYKDMKPFCNFINSNETDIFHDIMLLENQLPWPVIDAVLKFMPESPLERFIKKKKGCLADRKENDCGMRYDTYEDPPHLLGLLKYYVVGRSNPNAETSSSPWPRPESVETPESEGAISLSVGANDLAEMGVWLKANRTAEVIHMAIKPKWIWLAELSLAPLSLDDVRASCLVNMAALELCNTPNFSDNGVRDEDSAVCSYILLLASLVGREEDVHMLRKKHILQGGALLTDKEVLDFFTCFNGLCLGSKYFRIMQEIENYKSTMVTKVYSILYNHWKFLTGFVSAVISVVTFLSKFMKS